MNRLVRALLGVVVAKAAVASAWYLYQKSTEQENDWKTEGQEPVKSEDNKDQIEPVAMSTHTEVSKEKSVRTTRNKSTKEKQPVVESEVVKPKRIRKPVDGEMVKPKRIRKPATKKSEATVEKK